MYVRDVRAEFEQLKKNKAADAKKKKMGAGGSGQTNLPEVISYLPYKVTLSSIFGENKIRNKAIEGIYANPRDTAVYRGLPHLGSFV